MLLQIIPALLYNRNAYTLISHEQCIKRKNPAFECSICRCFVYDMDMKRILIIEDDLLMLRMTEMILQKEGHRTDFAMNGKDALQCLKTKSYDLVIIDLKLPFPNLQELTAQLRESRTIRDFSVMVIIMASFMESSVKDWFDMDVDAIITKPVDPYQMGRQVKQLLDRKSMQP